ncbi:hypothetical protein [Achromobacter deleyi]|uniref:hypothetical protein n=1 Tax=Achromobacter deleyi TaxID=1353891 RepID=UPI001491BAA0|nr:hypothetical protein [Achromobacter deleyi]QVQ26046.1 hypothetical protein HLG70_24835 [Achromobacter deleyi]UIP21598.1 hypothetical protein LYZ39_03505 [Achromobacter deleyi]
MKHDERCVTYIWLSRRPLFGSAYRSLLPDYFDSMPPESGVMIGSFLPSADIVPGLTFPGDIDVLIIPYEGDELVLSSALAVEIKIIRASFAKPGKSPNEFGFSQAKALLGAGFPYVAVGHLIVSDGSPRHAWREVIVTKLLDADEGTCGPIEAVLHDMLPWDLLSRSYGRLERNCSDPLLGLFSAYAEGHGVWFPSARNASLNPCMSKSVMDGIYAYYQKNYRQFFLTRRFPPSAPGVAFGEGEPAYMRHLENVVEKMRRDFR